MKQPTRIETKEGEERVTDKKEKEEQRPTAWPVGSPEQALCMYDGLGLSSPSSNYLKGTAAYCKRPGRRVGCGQLTT